jgi:hypothetical protein
VVVSNSQAAGYVGRCNGGTVTQSKNSVDVLLAHNFKNCECGGVRRFEVDGNRAIAPGIVKLVATISNKNEIDSEFSSRFIEAARLVTKFGGE